MPAKLRLIPYGSYEVNDFAIACFAGNLLKNDKNKEFAFDKLTIIL